MKYLIHTFLIIVSSFIVGCASQSQNYSTIYESEKPQSVTLMSNFNDEVSSKSIIIEELKDDTIKQTVFTYTINSDYIGFGNQAYHKAEYKIDKDLDLYSDCYVDYEMKLGKKLDLKTNILRSISFGKIFFDNNQNYFKSGWEVNLPDILLGSVILPSHKHSVSMGLGWQWSKYNMNSNLIPILGAGKKLCISPINETSTSNGFDLNNYALSLPLTWTYFPNPMLFTSLSVIGKYNYNTTCDGSYTNNGYTQIIKYHHLNSNEFGLSFRGTIMNFVGLWGLYVDWSPFQLFSIQNGPKFNSFSVGIYLSTSPIK